MTEAATIRNERLSEALLDFLSEQGSVTRERLFERFRQVSAEDVESLLSDLVRQGIVHATGRGPSTEYQLSSASPSSSCSSSSW
jgi:predicted HTH transcriptional regulator